MRAFLDAIQLARPQVLRGIIGNAVSKRGEGGNDQVVQFDGAAEPKELMMLWIIMLPTEMKLC